MTQFALFLSSESSYVVRTVRKYRTLKMVIERRSGRRRLSTISCRNFEPVSIRSDSYVGQTGAVPAAVRRERRRETTGPRLVGCVRSELLQNPSTSWDPFVLLNESEIEVRFALSLVRV